MTAIFNATAQALMRGLLQDHPDWQPYAVPYGPADDPETDPGSVMFSVPVPQQPAHCLEIALRGNTIEVAYNSGVKGTRAERQFIFPEAEVSEVIEEVRRFLSGPLDAGTRNRMLNRPEGPA